MAKTPNLVAAATDSPVSVPRRRWRTGRGHDVTRVRVPQRSVILSRSWQRCEPIASSNVHSGREHPLATQPDNTQPDNRQRKPPQPYVSPNAAITGLHWQLVESTVTRTGSGSMPSLDSIGTAGLWFGATRARKLVGLSTVLSAG